MSEGTRPSDVNPLLRSALQNLIVMVKELKSKKVTSDAL
jgi:hypothetical protein